MRLAILLLALGAVCAAAPQESDILTEVQNSPTETDAAPTVVEDTQQNTRRKQLRGILNRRFGVERRTNILKNLRSTTTTTTPASVTTQKNDRLSLIKRNRSGRKKLRAHKRKQTTSSPIENEPDLDATTTIGPIIEDPSTDLAPSSIDVTTFTPKIPNLSGRRINLRGGARRPSRLRGQVSKTVGVEEKPQLELAAETSTQPPRTRTRGNHRFRPRINVAAAQPTPTTRTSSRTSSRTQGRPISEPVQVPTEVKPATFRASRRGSKLRNNRLRTTTEKPFEMTTKMMKDLIQNIEKMTIMKDKTAAETKEMLKHTEAQSLANVEPEAEPEPEPEPEADHHDMPDSTDPTLFEETTKIFGFDESTLIPTEQFEEEIIEVSNPRDVITTTPHNFAMKKEMKKKVMLQRIPQNAIKIEPSQNENHRFSSRRRSGQHQKVVQKQVQNIGIPLRSVVKQSFVRAPVVDREVPVDNHVQGTSSRAKFSPQLTRSRPNPNPGVIQPAEFQAARDPFEIEALAALDFGSEFSTSLPRTKLRPLVVRQVVSSTSPPSIDITTFRPSHDLKHLISLSKRLDSPVNEPPATSTIASFTPEHPPRETNRKSVLNVSPVVRQTKKTSRGRTRTTVNIPKKDIDTVKVNIRQRQPVKSIQSRPTLAPKINTPSRVRSTPRPSPVVTPSPLFAAPLSNDVLSTLHQTSHKPMIPVPDYGKSELKFRGGEVMITEIGTIEDTHPDEVRLILSGLGGQRRGLARPPVESTPSKIATTTSASADKFDYYYDYAYDPAIEYEYYYTYDDQQPIAT